MRVSWCILSCVSAICNTFIDSFISLESSFIKYFFPSKVKNGLAESEVQEGLTRAMKDRTVIVIAHRLATTQEANKIVVFDNGQIIEVGKHIDLINKPGIYKELCEKQLIKEL